MAKARKAAPVKKTARKSSKPTFDLPKAAIVRIAKRNGAERIGEAGAFALVAKTERYIASITRKAVENAEAEGRKTIKAEDIP